MTQPTTTHPINTQFSPAKTTFGIALLGGANAIAAGLFTAVSPLGGAIFGVSSFLSFGLIHWICDKVNCPPDSIIFKVTQLALSAIGGIGTAVLITTTLGFPMTMATGIFLTLASAGVTLAATLALGNCLCSSLCITGIALGMVNERNTVTIRV